MQKNNYTLTLQSVKVIAPGVRHFAFICEEQHTFTFIPGQFITLHFDVEGKPLRRSYSIASIPGTDTTIDFAASYVEGGAASQLLFNLKPGHTVQASGPVGRLILRDEHPKRYIFIATGTGITPYRSMLPEIARRINEHQTRAIILQGVRKAEDLLYGDDFNAFAEKYNSHFIFHACYSQGVPENAKKFEQPGYVQNVFQQLNLNPAEDIIYLCGNPNMIDDAFALLKEHGFDQQHVRREKYLSSR